MAKGAITSGEFHDASALLHVLLTISRQSSPGYCREQRDETRTPRSVWPCAWACRPIWLRAHAAAASRGRSGACSGSGASAPSTRTFTGAADARRGYASASGSSRRCASATAAGCRFSRGDASPSLPQVRRCDRLLRPRLRQRRPSLQRVPRDHPASVRVGEAVTQHKVERRLGQQPRAIVRG